LATFFRALLFFCLLWLKPWKWILLTAAACCAIVIGSLSVCARAGSRL